MAAFELARELGADGVELDARTTRDGIVVVHHDHRLADGRAIREIAAAALPDGVPDLPTVLDACSGMLVNVEIKTDDGEAFDPHDPTPAALSDLITQRSAASMTDRVLVSSFDADAVGRFHQLAPGIPTALLTLRLDDPAAIAAAAARAGHVAIHPWDPTVDPAVVAAAHAAGVALNVWTVDDPDRVRQLAAMKVDAIVTNVPDVARAALDGGGTPSRAS